MENNNLKFEEVKVGHSYLLVLKNGHSVTLNNVAMVEYNDTYYFYEAYNKGLLVDGLDDIVLQDKVELDVDDVKDLVCHESINIVDIDEEHAIGANDCLYDKFHNHNLENYFHIEDFDTLIGAFNKSEVCYVLDITNEQNDNEDCPSLVS